MRKSSLKKTFVVLLASLLLGLVIIRSHTQNDVPMQVNVSDSARNNVPIGDITVKDFGYPLEYRQTQTFRENGTSNTFTQSVRLGTSIPSIIMNTVFWFGLLHLLSHIVPTRKPVAAKTADAAPPVAKDKELG